MTPLDFLLTAMGSLRVNALRSVLTTLGIIIGVSAVIVMVAIGTGAQQRVDEAIRSLGANIIVILPGATTSGGVRLGTGSRPTLTQDDAVAIAREIPLIAVSAPSVRGSVQVIVGNQNWYTNLHGVTADYFEARDWTLRAGRLFTETETGRAAKVALIGESIAANLFPDQDPIGQTVRIDRVPVEIIGILNAKGRTPMGTDQDDIVFTPIATARNRLLGNRYRGSDQVGSITLTVQQPEQTAEAEQQVRDLLRQRHRLRGQTPDDFSIRNISEIMSARQESSRIMTLLLGAVASISLVVGGIGIMNIMLVSVTERTREIGLRLAIGARGTDILIQFLIESVVLALVGGSIGVTLGLIAALSVAAFAGWPVVLTPGTVLLAFSFAAAIGIFFGFYPARKAARLDPIEALRNE